jgi:hypothetical protein
MSEVLNKILQSPEEVSMKELGMKKAFLYFGTYSFPKG